MMRPQPLRFMCGTAARMVWKELDRLIAMIWSHFSTGKSSIFRDTRDLSGFFVRDSDSSTFDKNLFPENYIQHLREAPEGDAITLVSSHDVVREAMSQEGWDFAVVFPRVEDKAVYLQRYADRGSPAAFLDLISASGCGLLS